MNDPDELRMLLSIPRFSAIAKLKVSKAREAQAFLLGTKEVDYVSGQRSEHASDEQMKDSGVWKVRDEVLSEVNSRAEEVLKAYEGR